MLTAETPTMALLDVNLKGEMVTPVAVTLRALGVPFVLASACNSAELGDQVLAEAPNLGKPLDEYRLLAALGQHSRDLLKGQGRMSYS